MAIAVLFRWALPVTAFSLTACAATPPSGDALIGADAKALIAAYGAPQARSVGAEPPSGSELVFVRRASLVLGDGLDYEPVGCDRLAVLAGVEDININCEDWRGWSQTGEIVPTICTLRFTLDQERRVRDFTAVPAGCDTRLSPR